MTEPKSPGTCPHCGAALLFQGQSICHRCAKAIGDPAQAFHPGGAGQKADAAESEAVEAAAGTPVSGAAPWKPEGLGLGSPPAPISKRASSPGPGTSAVSPARGSAPAPGSQSSFPESPWYRDDMGVIVFVVVGAIASLSTPSFDTSGYSTPSEYSYPWDEPTETPPNVVVITPATEPTEAAVDPSAGLSTAGTDLGGPTQAPPTFPAVDPLWAAHARLDRARAYHTATLLPDGRVAIIGGQASNDSRDALATVELYDPVLEEFEPGGRLADARYAHTATLLADGRLLVAGGVGLDGVPIASAEVYDPQTQKSQRVGDLAEARYKASAALLPDSRVLIIGGRGTDGPVGLPEVFDPATGEFGSGGKPLSGIHEASAMAVGRDGLVVLVGVTVEGSGEVVAVYDSADATFRYPAVTIATGRAGRTEAASCQLADGRMVVVGGWTHQGTSGAIEVIDTGNYASVLDASRPSLITPRVAPTVVALNDGSVLILGGEEAGGDPIATVEVWTPGDPTTTPLGAMSAARAGHTATLLRDGTVLVVGGRSSNGQFLDSAGIYSSWQPHSPTAAGGSAPPAPTPAD
jgi:hypothetical protein